MSGSARMSKGPVNRSVPLLASALVLALVIAGIHPLDAAAKHRKKARAETAVGADGPSSKSKAAKKAKDDDDEEYDETPEPPLADLAPGFSRTPYLQRLGTDSVLVAWVASAEGDPAVDFGTTLAYGSTAGATSDGNHRVAELRALESGTTYFYRVRAGDRVLAGGPEYTFRTDEGRRDDTYTFFATGDVGDRKGEQRLTAQSILRARPVPEFGIITGDIVYPRGKASDYDSHLMRPWADLLRRLPIWPALGNHDWHSDPQTNFRREWYLPNNEHYYSFDYGNAHFVALDSRDGDLYDPENQVRWLQADLETHAHDDWLFVFFHHPGLTCTYKGATAAVVQNLMPLFDRYHVDVVFNGHAHTYERLYPIRGGKPVDVGEDPDYTDPAGTIYIVTGAGSKVKEDKPTTRCGPTAAAKDETVLWTRVRVEGARCTIESYASADDRLVDVATITKSRLTRAASEPLPAGIANNGTR